MRKQIKLFLHLTSYSVICFLLPNNVAGQSQYDVREYYATEYDASPINYMVESDSMGMVYFANTHGLLSFDGERWAIYHTDHYSALRSLYLSSAENRLYVGGVGEFGYFEHSETLPGKYISISTRLHDSLQTFTEIWQVVAFEELIYFQSNENVFKYSTITDSIEILKLDQTYFFKLNADLIFVNDDSIWIEKGENIGIVKGKEILGESPIFMILPFKNKQWLIGTEDNGLFKAEISDGSFEIKPFHSDADSFLIKHSLYDGIQTSDGNYMILSWDGGVLILDEEGQTSDIMDEDDGLQNINMWSLTEASVGNWWIVTNNHIAHAKLREYDNDLYYANRAKSTSPLVFLEAGNKVFPTKGPTLTLSDSITNRKFLFACPTLDTHLSYSTRIINADDDWSVWTNTAERDLAHLSPGSYTLEVKAKDKFGNVSKVSRLAFEISAPWHRTLWGISLIILLFVGSISLLVWFSRWTVVKQNRKLELQILNRTRELEQEQVRLKKLNEDLNKANKELDNFVYRSSHDLVAPLKSLRGLINLSKMDSPPQSHLTYLEMMEKCSLRLESFISSITEYSTNVWAQYNKEEIHLRAFANEIWDDLRHQLDAAPIEFINDIDEEKVIYNDPLRLRIIFSNILTNSIKYHDPAKERKSIQIWDGSESGNDALYIQDNGIGIEDEHLEHIFEMFYRATAQAKGSGLGLYILKQAASKIDMEVKLDSTAGKGTMVTLIFDIKVAETDPTPELISESF